MYAHAVTIVTLSSVVGVKKEDVKLPLHVNLDNEYA